MYSIYVCTIAHQHVYTTWLHGFAFLAKALSQRELFEFFAQHWSSQIHIFIIEMRNVFRCVKSFETCKTIEHTVTRLEICGLYFWEINSCVAFDCRANYWRPRSLFIRDSDRNCWRHLTGETVSWYIISLCLDWIIPLRVSIFTCKPYRHLSFLAVNIRRKD